MSYILYAGVNGPMESRTFSYLAYFYAGKHYPKINSSEDFQVQLLIDFKSKMDFPGRQRPKDIFTWRVIGNRDVHELIRK